MLDVEVLRYESVTGIINEFKLPALKLKASGQLPEIGTEGQTVTWDIRGIPRDVGKFAGKHSAAGVRELGTIGQQTARLARTFESTRIAGSFLLDLRRPGSVQRQKLAEDQVAQALLNLRQMIDRQDEYMIAKALQGSLAMKVDGLDVTVDYGFDPTHILAIEPAGIPVAWDDPGADIIDDLDRILNLIAEDSGEDGATVWCSKETIKRLMQNETVKEYFASTPAGVQALTEGTIGRFYGLSWNAYNGTYVDAAGNVQRFIPENKIIVCPIANTDVAEMSVGTDAIMSDDDKDLVETAGLYSFARGVYNPAAIELFAGKVRLPIIKKPDAFVVAQVGA